MDNITDYITCLYIQAAYIVYISNTILHAFIFKLYTKLYFVQLTFIEHRNIIHGGIQWGGGGGSCGSCW